MSQEEKSQSLLMWILCLPIGIISPVIFMLVGKEKPGIYASSMQALTLSIILYVAAVCGVILSAVLGILTAGIGAALIVPVYLVIGVFALYAIIMGAVTSSNGKVYEPPITGPLAKKWFHV